MFSSQNSQVSNDVNYIEDVFNSYLWTTSASDQTLTTGIDMTKGALTWIKSRSNTSSHVLQTGIGGGVLPNNALSSNNTNAYFGGNYRIAESTTGFTMGTDYYTGTPQTAVVWTFRKQKKFYTQGTFTGDGTYNRVLSHDLGSVPACIIVKATSGSGDWMVWTKKSSGSFGSDTYVGLYLNQTAASIGEVSGTTNLGLTSTTFNIGKINLYDNYNASNTNGVSYVYYMFASDAGGFGLTGTDNVISCGSLTTDGSGNGSVNLGYEPQWLLVKRTDDVSQWYLADNMRGMPVSGDGARLFPNLSNAESTSASWFRPNATGFTVDSGMFASAVNLIYIAIRRGPMKVPTDATKVYQSDAYSGTGVSARSLTTLPAIDFSLIKWRTGNPYGDGWSLSDRLRGIRQLATNNTDAETGWTDHLSQFGPNQNTVLLGDGGTVNGSGMTYVNFAFRRAPSFFDEVCYTGNGTAGRTITHNLTVTPELIITKERSAGSYWYVYSAATGPTQYLRLESTNAPFTYSGVWNNTAPTSSVFTVGSDGYINASGQTYVAYLFATCAGVSKCTAFTGTGTLQTINCGFTSGARFVLIKRTDSTGDWYVWDSSRGLSSSTDPYLLLNSTAAEVTSTNWVDTTSTGFQVTAASGNNVNINGASYIALAIA